MEIFGLEISTKRIGLVKQLQAFPPTERGPSATSWSDEGTVYSNNGWLPMRSYSFNGEKTPGSLGKPINLVPDFQSLRIRSHEAHLSNDTIRTVVSPFFKWVVGSGLKLQAQPNEVVLRYEKVKENFGEFRANVESYWQIYSDSKRADFASMLTLHELAGQNYETAFFGDALTVLRVDANLNLTTQVIDGQHVRTPLLDSDYLKAAIEAGNTIFHGIEVDKTGKHVAFYVSKNEPGSFTGSFERIEAYGQESGCLMAWMTYGGKHRIDHHRGVSQIAPILEKVKKLDRYTEATIASAEERANVPYAIEHSLGSDGENPFENELKRKFTRNDTVSETPYQIGDLLAKKIAISEEKTVVNLPIGAKLVPIDSDSEINYEPLYKAIFMQISASANVPPEVALKQYNSNYSASRAAILAWGYEVNIARKKHSLYFYQNVYNLWLYIHILKNKVSASGYLPAMGSGNKDIVEAYSVARWTGAIMPHIDPKKEADAIRVMLGNPALGETPLMSRQQAAELLGLGEWEENFKEYQKEEKQIPKPPVPAAAPPAGVKKETVST